MVYSLEFMEQSAGGLYRDPAWLFPGTYIKTYWNIPSECAIITAHDVDNGQDIQGISWQNMEISRRSLRQKRSAAKDESESSDKTESSDKSSDGIPEPATALIFESTSEETNTDSESSDEESEMKSVESNSDGSGANAGGTGNIEDDDFFEPYSDDHGVNADGMKNEEEIENKKDHETEEAKGHPQTESENEEENANATLYEFFLNTREVRPRKGHHQLSDLVWAKSRDEVCVMKDRSSVSMFSLTTRESTEVYSGPTDFLISTFAIDQNLFIGGGMRGELVKIGLDGSEIRFNKEFDSITTSIEIHDSGCFTVTNNNGVVRVYDTETFELQTKMRCQFAVNKASLRPNGSVMLVGGESRHVRFADMLEKREGTAFYQMGDCHALAWHPDGTVFASWRCVTSLCFSSRGDVLLTGESDFVNLYSTKDEYRKRQRIDFFGPLAGMSLSPDDESLFIGINDECLLLSSLMIYHRAEGRDQVEEDGDQGEGLGGGEEDGGQGGGLGRGDREEEDGKAREKV